MPASHRRRARALFGLVFLVSFSAQAAPGWKPALLPWGKGLSLEVPAPARPELLGTEWFANSFTSGIRLPEGAGFASAFQHKFEENPLSLENYGAEVSFEARLKDLAIAKCYAESAEIYNYCPFELVSVRSEKTKWGVVYLVSGTVRFRRGGSGELVNDSMMLAVKTGDLEAVVLRSLAGEIKQRLMASLGIKVKAEFLPPKKAPTTPMLGAPPPLAK